jgi:FkbM family methyltransferase
VNGIYIGNNKILVQTKVGFRMLTHADDLSLTPNLVFNGVFEVPLTKYLISAVKQENIVFDLGANIGYFTLLSGIIVGKRGKVVSYEANKKNYNLLKENIAYNVMGDRIQLYNKAIYSEKKQLKFYSSNKWTGNGSLVPHSEEYFNRFSTDEILEEKIEAEPLEVHLDNFPFINFIKMDIEGGEYHGFLGMKNLLENKKIGEIIFELNYLRMKETWGVCKSLLENYRNDYNLTFYIIDKDGKLINTNLDDLFNQEFVESVVIKCNY